MSPEEWAESFQEDVFNYWKNEQKDWEWGFRVFYGPVFYRPEVLILGFQPGGSRNDFHRDHFDRYNNGDFEVPERHEYLTKKYRIAKVMRNKVFKDRKELLSETVKSNVIFFRAKDENVWDSAPDEKRQEMENFSLRKIEEMIDTLEPKVVLAEGMRTWDILGSQIGFRGECRVRRSNARLLCVSDDQTRTYAGIIHPSTHVSDEDWKKVRSELFNVIDT
ncbi:hypothetical protein ACLI4Q_16180 [Natrialbaceae archaeon A-CW1-1]